jgi:hypothetical protein
MECTSTLRCHMTGRVGLLCAEFLDWSGQWADLPVDGGRLQSSMRICLFSTTTLGRGAPGRPFVPSALGNNVSRERGMWRPPHRESFQFRAPCNRGFYSNSVGWPWQGECLGCVPSQAVQWRLCSEFMLSCIGWSAEVIGSPLIWKSLLPNGATRWLAYPAGL